MASRILLPPPPPCAMCLCRLLTLLTASLFKLVLCMSSEYCCLHRHPAPCATFGSPHTAARSRVCVMGPCTASHCC
ncbi:unnamed protein product [Staurois parvus]|uniref:Secreted protein n=1 Tax=Staurois parvus TaxID=386267 RepID=A0ABN9C761_9NEOB|nr:unnamed protein product [Staurois parvus]